MINYRCKKIHSDIHNIELNLARGLEWRLLPFHLNFQNSFKYILLKRRCVLVKSQCTSSFTVKIAVM